MPRGVRVNGEKIREIRETRATLDRKELAERIGLSYGGVYEIEVHRQTTQLVTLRKIAKVLRVKPEDLTA